MLNIITEIKNENNQPDNRFSTIAIKKLLQSKPVEEIPCSDELLHSWEDNS